MIYDWGENCSTNAFSSPVHLQVSCLFERKKDGFLPNTPGERGIETRKRRERHVSKHVFFPETKRLSSPAPLFMDDRKRRKNFTSSAKHRYNHHNSVELFPNNHCNRMEPNLSQKTILGFVSLLKNKSAWSESESPQIQQQKNITEYSKNHLTPDWPITMHEQINEVKWEFRVGLFLKQCFWGYTKAYRTLFDRVSRNQKQSEVFWPIITWVTFDTLLKITLPCHNYSKRWSVEGVHISTQV